MASSAVGIPLPPPYKGQNDQFPLVALQNPYADKMYNFNNRGGVAKVRDGNEIFATVSNAVINPLNISSYASAPPKLFAMVDLGVDIKWYDISSGTPSLVHTLGSGGDDEIQTLFFNNYQFYFGETALAPTGVGPQYYNGSVWGTAGYTWPASFVPFGGNVYKNRAYFIGRQSAGYGFSNIDAIAGPVTAVDLISVISVKAYLYIIRSISVSEGVTPQNVQAFIFSSGEVLVYAGSYPNSASWELISRFKVSKPLYNNTFVDAKGDSFIFTDSEILSLRNLYVNGYAQERSTGIGAAIKNRWQQIVRGLLAQNLDNRFFIKGVYDERYDRLVINLPNYVDPITGAVVQRGPSQLIYDFTLGAWYEYFQQVTADISDIPSACYHNDHIFTLVRQSGKATTISIDSGSNHLDDDPDAVGEIGIPYKLRSVPYPLSKFGVVISSGFEMIMKSDMYPTMNVKLIGDLGAQETGEQTTMGNGSEVSKVMVDIGIESNTVQYEISGESSDSVIGLEIYATNLWVTPSEGVAR